MAFIPSLILPTAIAAVIGYLLGSLSFSIIFTKLFKNKEDIRNYGSGNAGATNVLRSVGKLPAALTFIFDFLKCVLSVVLGYYILLYACNAAGAPALYAQTGKYAAGLGCIMGHLFPVFFGFKGGKGIVTAAALITLLDWRIFLPTFATFLIVFGIKKIVSLGSIIGMSLYPVYTFLILFVFDYSGGIPANTGNSTLAYIITVTVAAVCISTIIIAVHRPNIKRLRSGEEKPIVFNKKN